MYINNLDSARKRSLAPTIAGLAVKLPTPCVCGSHAATIAADNVLDCACGRRRNPLSERTIGFITELVRCYGAPPDPIILRRSPE
jgi:hypothetical protein